MFCLWYTSVVVVGGETTNEGSSISLLHYWSPKLGAHSSPSYSSRHQIPFIIWDVFGGEFFFGRRNQQNMKGFLLRFGGLRYWVPIYPPPHFSRHYVPYRRLGYVFRGRAKGQQTKSEEIYISLSRIASVCVGGRNNNEMKGFLSFSLLVTRIGCSFNAHLLFSPKDPSRCLGCIFRGEVIGVKTNIACNQNCVPIHHPVTSLATTSTFIFELRFWGQASGKTTKSEDISLPHC